MFARSVTTFGIIATLVSRAHRAGVCCSAGQAGTAPAPAPPPAEQSRRLSQRRPALDEPPVRPDVRGLLPVQLEPAVRSDQPASRVRHAHQHVRHSADRARLRVRAGHRGRTPVRRTRRSAVRPGDGNRSGRRRQRTAPERVPQRLAGLRHLRVRRRARAADGLRQVRVEPRLRDELRQGQQPVLARVSLQLPAVLSLGRPASACR